MVKTLPLEQALQTLSLPGHSDNLFSSPMWLNVINRAYRPDVFVKYIERDGRIESYVFYSVVKNFLEWKVCVLSYCDYCDAHIVSASDWIAVFEDIKREYPGFRIVVRSLRDDIARTCGCFKELSREYFHLLDIRGDIDSVWKGLKDKFRNQVRQGTKRGLVVRPCERRELWDFFCIHVKLRKHKYGIFSQPWRFFEVIWEEFIAKGNGFLLGAFDPEGKMVGGTLFLVCGNTLYYKINTSSQNALEFRSNNCLLWEGIRLAKERGLEFIDLGSSGFNQEGLVSFKDATGARRMEIVHIGYHPQGYVFSQKRVLKAYTRFFAAAWMPDWITNMGSALIYKFLA
ncbi:MAG: GNAT family N-acetyltransferase [Candidatus Omnitrophica bacterium]|nr:GNAT family N-acetyltransferase [Candidatus Omnitrophota bacterium]